ncbi:hypothetical protein RJ640_007561 [Escallonia rubra]|uniref:Protein kinase domain-containing protein n=1 Tax=Escallonia rubra TaxID=112253 RepID=A0AA88RX03_9ASTE|nr:hypothetical protein RJ640_007561 [Escallonia rubra]
MDNKHHINLVKQLGFCAERSHRLLMFRVAKGHAWKTTLAKLLFTVKINYLEWIKKNSSDFWACKVDEPGSRSSDDPNELSKKIIEKAHVTFLEFSCWKLFVGGESLITLHSNKILKENAETNNLVDLVGKCSVDMQRQEEKVVELMKIAIWYLYVDPTRRPFMSTMVKRQRIKSCLALLPDLPKRFSFEGLKLATQNFDVNKRLGSGGFRLVFEETLSDGTRVAVRCLNHLGHSCKVFLAEDQTIVHTPHQPSEIVGIFVPKDHTCFWCTICENLIRFSKWGVKKKIMLKVAEGLAYLHEECKKKVIHLDVKPQNILVDENLNANLSDYGLSTEDLNKGYSCIHALERLSRKINKKAEVCNFVVVMLEVVQEKWSRGTTGGR